MKIAPCKIFNGFSAKSKLKFPIHNANLKLIINEWLITACTCMPTRNTSAGYQHKSQPRNGEINLTSVLLPATNMIRK